MRIGLLGGTFNPIHNGHIYIAEQAIRKLRLDKVIFVPAYMPPHKKLNGKASAGERLKMLRLAIKNNRKFGVLAYEIRKKGKSYSIGTVRHLKKKLGKNTQLFFLIGSDSLKGLKKWKNIKGLMRIVRFAVISRPGFAMNPAAKDILMLNVPGKDISSTEIRKSVKNAGPVEKVMPKKAYRYMMRKNLYA